MDVGQVVKESREAEGVPPVTASPPPRRPASKRV